MNLASLIARLDQNFDRIANEALASAAEGLANDIKQALGTAPGGPHDHPWCQTGALQSSVGWQAEGANAVIGSCSDIAFHQENGTATMPPRPTFGPVAAQSAPKVASGIGAAIMRALGQS